MPYRVTKRKRERLAAMRAAKERKRMDLGTDDPRFEPPELRRRVVVMDYDFGEVTHVLDLYRTDRIDCYRVDADGKPWRDRVGWSGVLEGLRKSLPRVLSSRSVE